MAFLSEWADSHRRHYLSKVSMKIQERERTGTPISPEEWEALHPMNSYERNYLMHLVDDALLVQIAEYYLMQSGSAGWKQYDLPGHTYSDNLHNVITPMLVERLRKRDKEQKT